MKLKLFEEFVSEVRNSVGDNYRDSLTYEKFEAAVTDIFDKENRNEVVAFISDMLGIDEKSVKNLLESFAWANAKLRDSKQNIKPFYNFLMNLNPRRKVEKSFLGSGVDGAVFQLQDCVVKFFYTERSNEVTNVYKKLKGDYKTLPKIFRANNSFITMEKLKVETEKSNAFANVLAYKLDASETELEEYVKRYEWADEILQWLKDFEEEAEESGLSYLSMKSRSNRRGPRWDTSETNFGERENGEVVFFDPLYLGKIATREYEKDLDDEENIPESYQFKVKHGDIKNISGFKTIKDLKEKIASVATYKKELIVVEHDEKTYYSAQ